MNTPRWTRYKYRTFRSIEDRLWGRAIKTPQGCWEFPWNGNAKCRPGISYEGERWIVARLAYHLTYGEIPPKMHVCHHCDNPLCFNPEHLFLGTPTDNARDMVRKGRGIGNPPRRIGEAHSQALLTEAQVREIRDRYVPYSRTLGTRVFARKFNVSRLTVSSVVCGVNWKHVT